MQLVKNETDLLRNLKKINFYLTKGTSKQIKETLDLLKRGKCFIAYEEDNELRFGPSRFIGYFENSLNKHSVNSLKNGGDTNKRITNILGNNPFPDDFLDSEFSNYCNMFGIKIQPTGTFGTKRKYWNFKGRSSDLTSLHNPAKEFEEGHIIDRRHIIHERNPQAVKQKKIIFKAEHGVLFCEVCGFDFEEKYGELGKDFIECHHTIPMSEMNEDHVTKIQDLVLLCANCHSIIHRKTPCLSIEELKILINKTMKYYTNKRWKM